MTRSALRSTSNNDVSHAGQVHQSREESAVERQEWRCNRWRSWEEGTKMKQVRCDCSGSARVSCREVEAWLEIGTHARIQSQDH